MNLTDSDWSFSAIGLLLVTKLLCYSEIREQNEIITTIFYLIEITFFILPQTLNQQTKTYSSLLVTVQKYNVKETIFLKNSKLFYLPNSFLTLSREI